jgi:lysophospholipase L1-like esterase
VRKSRLYLFILIALILSCSPSPKVKNIDSQGKNIICFGDSITYGKGATPGNDYPSLLAKKLNIPVINAGVNGDTTRGALKRLKRDVLDKDPLLVIIELGANDYLKGISIEETLSNLEKMIKEIQAKGAMVAITEIHSGFFLRRLAIGVKKLAKRYKALYIPNILEGILGNKDLCSDPFHPNDKGYELIAERVYEKIKPILDVNFRYRKP